MVDLFWDSSPLDRKKFAHEKRLRSVRQSQGTVLYRTVQRHREGPDANGATHTERGPGPSNTTLPYCTNLPEHWYCSKKDTGTGYETEVD